MAPPLISSSSSSSEGSHSESSSFGDDECIDTEVEARATSAVVHNPWRRQGRHLHCDPLNWLNDSLVVVDQDIDPLSLSDKASRRATCLGPAIFSRKFHRRLQGLTTEEMLDAVMKSQVTSWQSSYFLGSHFIKLTKRYERMKKKFLSLAEENDALKIRILELEGLQIQSELVHDVAMDSQFVPKVACEESVMLRARIEELEELIVDLEARVLAKPIKKKLVVDLELAQAVGGDPEFVPTVACEESVMLRARIEELEELVTDLEAKVVAKPIKEEPINQIVASKECQEDATLKDEEVAQTLIPMPTIGSVGFGQPTFQTQVTGSREAPYTAITEPDDASGLQPAEKLESISAMPIYKDKSHEEFRCEDYLLGNKGSSVLGEKQSFEGLESTSKQTNSFGSSFQQAFDSNLFRSHTSFSATSHPALCAVSSQAIGSKTMPAFSSTSSQLFGNTRMTFGQSTTPAFGPSSMSSFKFNISPPFSQSTPTFGSSLFGSSSSSFGTHSS